MSLQSWGAYVVRVTINRPRWIKNIPCNYHNIVTMEIHMTLCQNNKTTMHSESLISTQTSQITHNEGSPIGQFPVDLTFLDWNFNIAIKPDLSPDEEVVSLSPSLRHCIEIRHFLFPFTNWKRPNSKWSSFNSRWSVAPHLNSDFQSVLFSWSGDVFLVTETWLNDAEMTL